MGVCFSAQVKAENPYKNPYNTGLNPNNKVSAVSVPRTAPSESEIMKSSNLKRYTYAELKTATVDFCVDNILGEGGFGFVYKGWIDENSLVAAKPDTGIAVAVKKLNRGGFQGHREWLAEVKHLGMFSHPHIVRLIGYCLEDGNHLLVYEFMPQGSLENHLFRRGEYYDLQPLSWSLRLNIALGAAKGIAFLHGSKTKVIYRDFKTSNVLLDSDYNAKLSDFGLARNGPEDDETHVSTRIMGTNGYADPEYVDSGHLTTKSDVYSFGVVLLEMVCGRSVIDYRQPYEQLNLLEWGKPYLFHKREVLRVLDSQLEGQCSAVEAYEVTSFALRCLSEKSSRPNMDEVVSTLEQLVHKLQTRQN